LNSWLSREPGPFEVMYSTAVSDILSSGVAFGDGDGQGTVRNREAFAWPR
jgi:hypothetical protein